MPAFLLLCCVRRRASDLPLPGLPRDQFSRPWRFSTAEARTIIVVSSLLISLARWGGRRGAWWEGTIQRGLQGFNVVDCASL